LSFICDDLGVSLSCLGFVFGTITEESVIENIPASMFGMFLFTSDCTGKHMSYGDEESIRGEWEYILKLFWNSKCLQKLLYRRARASHTFRLGILKYCIEALCRRKDRCMFELLVQMEPFIFVNTSLDDTIDTLEITRGKKGRILSYMKAFKASAQLKDSVLNEICPPLRLPAQVSCGSHLDAATEQI